MEFSPIFLSRSELISFSMSIIPGFLSVIIQMITPGTAIIEQTTIMIAIDVHPRGKMIQFMKNTNLCFIVQWLKGESISSQVFPSGLG